MQVLAALAVSLFAPLAAAQDACGGFKWDVAAERALFLTSPLAITAAAKVSTLPALDPAVLYELALLPQEQVHFAAPPGKKPPGAGRYAGLAMLRVTSPGSYRIALDEAAWIDVVVAGQPLRSLDFAGQHGCRAPHKIVLFELPVGEVLLQLSDAASPRVRISLTRSPETAR